MELFVVTRALEMDCSLILLINIKNLFPLRAIYEAIIMVNDNTNSWKRLSLLNIVEATIKIYSQWGWNQLGVAWNGTRNSLRNLVEAPFPRVL
jgi:hypothetical protein